MKKMMMALAALCVAGAASAVDINWTGWNAATWNETDSAWTVADKPTFTGGTDVGGAVSYAALVTGANGWSNDTVVMELRDTGDAHANGTGKPAGAANSGLRVVYNNGQLKLQYNNNSAWTDFGASQGTVDISQDFTVGIYTQRTGTGSTFTLYINGVAYTTSTDAHGNIGLFQADLGKVTLANGVTDLHTRQGDYSVVPEPTALALLALGVAGLALRRKAA